MSKNYAIYPQTGDDKWRGDPNLSITGTGFSVPRGIEAVISYNGLIMNDTTVFDKYRVMEIDGLADADIRDSREVRHGDTGEDSWQSYYGGRSIVMKVRIEAYQLDKLRDMEEALRTAFVNMEELPLYFLTNDPEKDHYINVKKNTALTKSEDVGQYKGRFFRDWQISLRASDPRFYRAKRKYVTVPIELPGGNQELNDSMNMENAGDINDYTLSKTGLGTITSGVSTDWASSGTKSLKLESTNALTTVSKIWRTVGNVTGGNSFTIDGNYRLDKDFNVEVYVTPYLFWLDENDQIIGHLTGTRKGYLSDGISDGSYHVSGNAPTNATQMLMEIRVEDNFGFWKFYVDEMSMRYTYAYSESNPYVVVNVGNFNSEPVITLFGKMNNPEIWNDGAPEPYNNIKFKAGTVIAEGDFRRIDIKNRTVVDSNGANKFSEIDLSSNWLRVYPGDNAISLSSGTTFDGSEESGFSLVYRDAWI